MFIGTLIKCTPSKKTIIKGVNFNVVYNYFASSTIDLTLTYGYQHYYIVSEDFSIRNKMIKNITPIYISRDQLKSVMNSFQPIVV